MKRNIGICDSFIRVTIGLIMLGCGIAKKCACAVIAGSAITASGVTGFCPGLYIAERKSRKSS